MVCTSNHSRNNRCTIRSRNSNAAKVVSGVKSLELDEWVESEEDSDEDDAEDYFWLLMSMEIF